MLHHSFFFFYIVFTGSKHFSNSSQDLSKLSNYQTCCFKAALETSVLNWWILSFFPPFAVSLWLAVFLRVPLMSRKLEIIQSANGFSITPHQSERRRNSHINLAIKCKTGVWINIVVGSIKSTVIPSSVTTWMNHATSFSSSFTSSFTCLTLWHVEDNKEEIIADRARKHYGGGAFKD